MGLRLYTVHGTGHPDDLDLVPEGFSWGAFVLGPLWLVWHRLWWALAGWLGVALVLALVARWLMLGDAQQGVLQLALAFALGLLGHDLRRQRLTAGKRPVIGVVSGETDDAALRRLMDARP